jgi:hypothetical protein
VSLACFSRPHLAARFGLFLGGAELALGHVLQVGRNAGKHSGRAKDCVNHRKVAGFNGVLHHAATLAVRA